MKKNFIPAAILIITITGFLNSCNQDIPTGISMQPYTFTKLDEDGGTWKPVLLTSGSEITVAAPDDITSATYQDELASMKSMMSNLTDDQKKPWSIGERTH